MHIPVQLPVCKGFSAQMTGCPIHSVRTSIGLSYARKHERRGGQDAPPSLLRVHLFRANETRASVTDSNWFFTAATTR